MTDTSKDMEVDTNAETIDGVIQHIMKATPPSIARVYCVVVLKSLSAERDALQATVKDMRESLGGCVSAIERSYDVQGKRAMGYDYGPFWFG